MYGEGVFWISVLRNVGNLFGVKDMGLCNTVWISHWVMDTWLYCNNDEEI